jgi:hypothetical protein
MAKKDPPNNRIMAGITTGVSAALAWNANRKKNKDARLLMDSQRALQPNKDTMSFNQAKDTVSLLGESKSGRRQLRGLRASGQLQDIRDWKKKNKATKKASRMQKRYPEMGKGGTHWTRSYKKSK